MDDNFKEKFWDYINNPFMIPVSAIVGTILWFVFIIILGKIIN